ncbi:MAG: carboxypeptidase-like regulatory domain-containing protein [bacterium]
MRWRVLLLLGFMAAPLRGQLPASKPMRVVSGVVFDSIANAPLAGAVVQAALVDSTVRVFSAVADADGRFRIAGLPAGRFAIGFQHNALYALGLESPLRAFELTDDVSALTVDLAIPSGRQVNTRLCGNVARDARDGMLAGYVLGARNANTLSGAVVVVQWLEVELVKGDFHTESHRSTAPVDAEGHYVACAVATEAAVGVRVTMPGYRALDAEVVVPAGGVARQDFRLADSAVSRGTSTLIGRVVHSDGTPISAGRATIASLSIEAPVLDGVFTMADIPAGTWLVEALAIGFEPQSILVDAAEQTSTSATIVIARRARMLDAITVIGSPTGELKVMEGIVARSRTAFGSVFLPGNPTLKAALRPLDVIRAARGFSYVGADSVTARGCNPPSKRGIAVYVDGLRFKVGMEQLKNVIPMRELLAIEAYPDAMSTPIQWRQNDICAVIALWTKR